jgi:hypothetical protein
LSIDTRNKDYSVLIIGREEDVHEAEHKLSRLYDWTVFTGFDDDEGVRIPLLDKLDFLVMEADAVITIDDTVSLASEQAIVLLAMHLGLDVMTFAEAVDMFEFLHGELDCS